MAAERHRSGSIIATVQVMHYEGYNEGSVQDTVETLKSIAPSTYNQYGYNLIDPVGSVSSGAAAPRSDGVSVVGLIAGITCETLSMTSTMTL